MTKPIEILNKNILLSVSDDTQKLYVLNKLTTFNKDVLNINHQQESSMPLNYNIQENGLVIAGINANLYFLKSILHIDNIFVEEKYRSNGFGSMLLQKVERIAKEEYKSHLSHLDTFDWQAKDFYLKHGYEIFGILEDSPKGHKRYYMKKSL